jgi:hypothetical protein
MTVTYWWAKAAPGLYYLRDGPRGAQRLVVARVRRTDKGRYQRTIYIPGHESDSDTGKPHPKTARERVQAEIAAIHPDGAYFKHENF